MFHLSHWLSETDSATDNGDNRMVCFMDAFSPVPPSWAETAHHAYGFVCPSCGATATQAKAVWINRRSPVYTPEQRRKWQEFYHCGECDTAWWGWSSDRPTMADTEEDPT